MPSPHTNFEAQQIPVFRIEELQAVQNTRIASSSEINNITDLYIARRLQGFSLSGLVRVALLA